MGMGMLRRTRLGQGGDSGGEGWQEGPTPPTGVRVWGAGAVCAVGLCQRVPVPTHLRRELGSLLLWHCWWRWRCTAARPWPRATRGTALRQRGVSGGLWGDPGPGGDLTPHGGGVLAVVEDGQLPKSVPRPQRAELPASLVRAELPLCRDTARGATHTRVHACTWMHTCAWDCSGGGQGGITPPPHRPQSSPRTPGPRGEMLRGATQHSHARHGARRSAAQRGTGGHGTLGDTQHPVVPGARPPPYPKSCAPAAAGRARRRQGGAEWGSQPHAGSAPQRGGPVLLRVPCPGTPCALQRLCCGHG